MVAHKMEQTAKQREWHGLATILGSVHGIAAQPCCPGRMHGLPTRLGPIKRESAMEHKACYISIAKASWTLFSHLFMPVTHKAKCSPDLLQVPFPFWRRQNDRITPSSAEEKKAIVTQHFSLNKSFLMTSNKSSCNHIPLPLKPVKVYLLQLKY